MSFYKLFAATASLAIAGCQQGFVVTQATLQNDSFEKGQELDGFPIQATTLQKVVGELTAHTMKIACQDRQVEKFIRVPLKGEYYFISPPRGLFASHKLSFELHPDGSLKSMNSEAPSPASEIASVISALPGLDGKAADAGSPPCNTNFVAYPGQFPD